MLTRKSVVMALLLMLIFTMSACSSQSDDASTKRSTDGVVELTMWEFGSTGYTALAEKYMEQNPNVKINVQFSEMADMHNNLFTALSAGSGAPDIALVEVAHIERYRDAQDKFNNLYDFGAEDIKGDYLDWKWDLGQSADGGFLFGLPTDIGPTVMYYRTDVFEAAGLPSTPDEVSKLISTWEDFRTVARTIEEKTGKPMTDGPNPVFNALRDQSPEHYFNKDDELIIEDSPYVKRAYDYTVNLINDGVVGQFNMWTPEWGTAMNDGSFAVMLAPAWMQGVIKGNAPDAAGKWSITTMPEGAGNWGGSYLTIPAQSKNAQAAYDFISWLVSPENQLASFKDQGLFPSTPSVYSDPAFTDIKDDYFSGIATAQVFAEAAEQVKSVYTGKNYQLVTDELVVALENVNIEKKDPEKEWTDALDRIKRLISRQ